MYCDTCNVQFDPEKSKHLDNCPEVAEHFKEYERYSQRAEIAQLIRDYYQERLYQAEASENPALNEQLKGIEVACRDLYTRVTGDDEPLELEVKDVVSSVPADF